VEKIPNVSVFGDFFIARMQMFMGIVAVDLHGLHVNKAILVLKREIA
jgi:hypothetical protein